MDLMLITRSRLKQSKIPLLISRGFVVGCFFNFLGDFFFFGKRYFFSKDLVKLKEIGNIEDLMN